MVETIRQHWRERLYSDDMIALVVLLVATLLRVVHLDAIVNNYDEGVYTASLRALSQGNVLYGEIYHAQPPLFLYVLLPWFLLFGKTLVAARLGVVIYALIGIIAMWWLGRQLGGPRVGLIAAALFAFDPLYLDQSRAVLAEAPALAFAVLAVAVAATTRQRQRPYRALLAAALFVVSLGIKFYTLPALLPIVAFVLMPTDWPVLIATLWHERRWVTVAELRLAWRTSKPTIEAFAIGVATIVVLVLLVIGSQYRAAWEQMIGLHVAATGSFSDQRGANIAIFLGIGPEYVLIAAGLLAGYLGFVRRVPVAMIVALWGLASAIVLAVQTPLFAHHMTLLTAPFALGAALLSTLAPLPDMRRSFMRLAKPTEMLVLTGMLTIALLVGLWRSVALLNNAQRHPDAAITSAAFDLQVYTLGQPAGLVVTDDQEVAVIADRNVPAALADTSFVRIAAGKLTTAQVIAAASNQQVSALLWFSGRFDRLPGLRDWVVRNFVLVIDYGDGHGLYLPMHHPTGTPIT